MNVTFNPAFTGSKRNNNTKNIVKIAGLAAAVSAAPYTMTAQEITDKTPEIIKEFKQIDKDENLKINTLEYLDYISANTTNAKELNQKLKTALKEFDKNDNNTDGELNIDEYIKLKTSDIIETAKSERKVNTSSNYKSETIESVKPAIIPTNVKAAKRKLSAKEEEDAAYAILNELKNTRHDIFYWGKSKSYIEDSKKLNKVLTKINPENVVGVFLSNDGNYVKNITERYETVQMSDFLDMLEKRAQMNGKSCLKNFRSLKNEKFYSINDNGNYDGGYYYRLAKLIYEYENY